MSQEPLQRSELSVQCFLSCDAERLLRAKHVKTCSEGAGPESAKRVLEYITLN